MKKQSSTKKELIKNKIPLKLEKAAFAAGCFWHVEETFRKLKGFISTTVGYMGGTTKNPTYEQVCTNTTGHAETIEITYDPKQITYQQLLEIFWSNHDPTTLNRQGPDIGTQYRSIIFYYIQEQKNIAQQSKKLIQKKYSEPIVTEITKATTFYKAEEYHQKYLQKRGLKVCPI